MKRVVLVGILGAILLSVAVGFTTQAIVRCTGGVCRGTPAGDSITGSQIRDIIYPGGGSDRVDAKRGNDSVFGSTGNDRLSGGLGADGIFGNEGNDILVGNLGQDKIDGAAGNDRVLANDGNVDRITCGDGADAVQADFEDTVDASCEIVRRS